MMITYSVHAEIYSYKNKKMQILQGCPNLKLAGIPADVAHFKNLVVIKSQNNHTTLTDWAISNFATINQDNETPTYWDYSQNGSSLIIKGTNNPQLLIRLSLVSQHGS
jgi:hypothetical protein